MSHGVVNGSTFFKHEDEKNKLRIGGGSWTINLDEVDLTKIETIKYETKYRRYSITTSEALEHGFERTLGGENKLVVPVKYWLAKHK